MKPLIIVFNRQTKRLGIYFERDKSVYFHSAALLVIDTWLKFAGRDVAPPETWERCALTSAWIAVDLNDRKLIDDRRASVTKSPCAKTES